MVLLKRIGAITGAILSLWLLAIGITGLIFIKEITLFLLAGFFIGLAYSLVTPVGSQIISDLGDTRRSNFLFSIKQSSVSIGAGGAGLALPFLSNHFGWHLALTSILFLVVAMLLTGYSIKSGEPKSINVRNEHFSYRELLPISGLFVFLRHPLGKRLALASLVFALGQYGIMAIFVVWVWDQLDLGASLATQLFLVVMSFGIFGRVFWGYIADKIGAKSVLTLQLLFSCLCCIFMGLLPKHPNLILLLLFSASLGFIAMSWSGLLLSEVTRAGNMQKNRSMGVIEMTAGVQILFYAGGLLGPSLLSSSYILTGSFQSGHFLIAALFGVSLVAYQDPFIRRSKR